jgi:1-deoxy-D-xylulose-5-phosphate reductoisomerase
VNVILLGATGSIGSQTLELMKVHRDTLIGFSFGNNLLKAIQIIDEFQPQIVCAKEPRHAEQLQTQFPTLKVVVGESGLEELAGYPVEATLVNALVGSVGLRPTVKAIKSRKRICLANKETLVIAGELIMKLVTEYAVELLPIDSEHAAIHQAMQGDLNIASIVLTASGGSLRDWPIDQLQHATKQDVLQHPNWSMGEKITVDSATMMNKGFEIIEAHHLFGLSFDLIETILHPQSLVHGMVRYHDGSMLAHIAPPTMSIPIAYALYHPLKIKLPTWGLKTLSTLEFSMLDEQRYPLLTLAREVGIRGGIHPCVMNAANEAAVRLFLEEHIPFPIIETIIRETISSIPNEPLESIDQIVLLDQSIQEDVYNKYKTERRSS